jgi:phosphoribosylanthranilate isomerase
MQPKLKICGLFRDEDIDFVNEFPPRFAGFVFAESKRKVTPEAARKLIKRLSPEIIPVGVFLDEKLENIAQIAMETNIKIIQLHGNEDDFFIEQLRKLVSLPVIKALKPGQTPPQNADFLLFDSETPGSGKPFDRSSLPKTEKPYFLAGGINAGNIKEAIALCPYAIDISSGVETGGIKNREKIEEIVKIIKSGGQIL